MIDPNTTIYPLTVYANDFRWYGECAIPSQRRLSDFVNDTATPALVLNHVIPAVWEKGALHELARTESLALIKQNVLLIASHMAPPAPLSTQIDRVSKIPFSVIAYIPPYSLTGELSLSRNADWLHVVTTGSDDFIVITKASIWNFQTLAKLETDVRLVCINRRHLLAIEPKR